MSTLTTAQLAERDHARWIQTSNNWNGYLFEVSVLWLIDPRTIASWSTTNCPWTPQERSTRLRAWTHSMIARSGQDCWRRKTRLKLVMTLSTLHSSLPKMKSVQFSWSKTTKQQWKFQTTWCNPCSKNMTIFEPFCMATRQGRICGCLSLTVAWTNTNTRRSKSGKPSGICSLRALRMSCWSLATPRTSNFASKSKGWWRRPSRKCARWSRWGM